MEHRVRNIRLTSEESAKMIWGILIDFQNDLAKEEMEKTILVEIPSKIYPELRQLKSGMEQRLCCSEKMEKLL